MAICMRHSRGVRSSQDTKLERGDALGYSGRVESLVEAAQGGTHISRCSIKGRMAATRCLIVGQLKHSLTFVEEIRGITRRGVSRINESIPISRSFANDHRLPGAKAYREIHRQEHTRPADV